MIKDSQPWLNFLLKNAGLLHLKLLFNDAGEISSIQWQLLRGKLSANNCKMTPKFSFCTNCFRFFQRSCYHKKVFDCISVSH